MTGRLLGCYPPGSTRPRLRLPRPPRGTIPLQGKKKFLARVGAGTGFTHLIETLPKPASLLVLNYHRIGDANRALYDSDEYSCTADDFDWQIGRLKRRYPIVDLAKAVDIVHGRATAGAASVLLTFDDGYRDNYDLAFPVLRAHGVSATFFLPTAFVGSDVLPWWDVVAAIVKNSSRTRVALAYPEAAEFDLSVGRRDDSIRAMLKLAKRPSVTDRDRFIRELAAACDAPRATKSPERCFLNWDEAREMQKGGMRFGSHGHTHEILSGIPHARQVDELRTSRRILESELGRPIDTLAYPDGQLDTFNAETFKALEETGYTTAFSFSTGINIPGRIRPYNVLRGDVDGDDRATFRLRVALRAATRRELF
ncbi:MAG: polysaccharide deacetylase family protein [Elusimicrobiota bacterium]